MARRFYFPLIILLFTLLFFGSGLTNYFGGDDWFHLQVSQINSGSEFINFFNPWPNPQMTAFYRPLPNQVFFFFCQQLFGFQVFGYHLVIYLLFGASLFLFNQLLSRLGMTTSCRRVAVLLYTVSATHFSQLYFVSANQEIFLLFFTLLYLNLGLCVPPKTTRGGRLAPLIALAGALLSKDTAVVAPLLLVVLRLYSLGSKPNFSWRNLPWRKHRDLLGSGLLVAVYLIIRFVIFQNEALADESYQLNFSLPLALNSLYFYAWWLLGAPELIVDYMPTVYSFLPRFFTDLPQIALPMIGLGLTLGGSFLLLIISSWRQLRQRRGYLIFSASLSLILLGLLPVIFLPTHKFTIQLGLPLLGVAWGGGFLLTHWGRGGFWSRCLVGLILLLFLSFNYLTVRLTLPRSYITQRAQISWRAKEYFQTHYPQLTPGQKIYVTNASTVGADIPTWGSSRQVAFALWHSSFIQALYHDQSLTMFYQDLLTDTERTALESSSSAALITIPASEFL